MFATIDRRSYQSTHLPLDRAASVVLVLQVSQVAPTCLDRPLSAGRRQACCSRENKRVAMPIRVAYSEGDALEDRDGGRVDSMRKRKCGESSIAWMATANPSSSDPLSFCTCETKFVNCVTSVVVTGRRYARCARRSTMTRAQLFS